MTPPTAPDSKVNNPMYDIASSLDNPLPPSTPFPAALPEVCSIASPLTACDIMVTIGLRLISFQAHVWGLIRRFAEQFPEVPAAAFLFQTAFAEDMWRFCQDVFAKFDEERGLLVTNELPDNRQALSNFINTHFTQFFKNHLVQMQQTLIKLTKKYTDLEQRYARLVQDIETNNADVVPASLYKALRQDMTNEILKRERAWTALREHAIETQKNASFLVAQNRVKEVNLVHASALRASRDEMMGLRVELGHKKAEIVAKDIEIKHLKGELRLARNLAELPLTNAKNTNRRLVHELQALVLENYELSQRQGIESVNMEKICRALDKLREKRSAIRAIARRVIASNMRLKGQVRRIKKYNVQLQSKLQSRRLSLNEIRETCRNESGELKTWEDIVMDHAALQNRCAQLEGKPTYLVSRRL
eukprot:Blabericola_migrator_1__2793@NODE_17_length_22983_cov_74_609923_g14_i0_p7_GENE_NODE_17_length_22983_cov_74_609923_g14_i0NODE_17_length_22983_cov_74_609923_g14_i0_p7_ORF_typecomplete_len418_score78_09SH2_2/PF14633_6/0_087GAS/PF13851_6/1_6GAS/PF13851_6/82GAS/PF13851_6/0_07Spot_14/PF07084_12/0_26LprI/PF07007_12/0_25Fez1/PF06818_15/1_2e02Fez1/PF06818_15/0_018Med10/PF09748_9/6_8e02Med10/PF09748_9/0_078DUF810/PF05664_11/0_37Baculo_PEP_C/PF04513_12/0_33Baculo_PEP_C/PF04513_12/1_6e03Baculo_PEP_C/PF04513